MDDGLHGIIFRPRNVMVPEGVPYRDGTVLDRTVLRGVTRQALAGRALVDVVAGRPAFVGASLRHPEVVGREAGALRHLRAGQGEGAHGAVRHEPIGRMLAEGGSAGAVDDLPVADSAGVGLATRRCLGGQRGLDRAPSVVPRIVGAGRIRLGVDLQHGVLRSVHRHVQPHVENVLVVVPDHARLHQRATAGRAVRQAGPPY